MACMASPVAIRHPSPVLTMVNVVTVPKSQAPQIHVPVSPVPSARSTALPQRSPHAMSNKTLGHYILGKTIGEGTFGKVKLGRHILTGERVAVKVLEKDRIQEVADIERVAREVQLLKLIRHPHVVQLFEIIETKGQLYLIMEYASGGELFDYIVQHQRVPEVDACCFFHQIIAGVEKIHQLNVVHRDLKPENLLLDEHKCIKIVDFGLSNRFEPNQLLKTACGSPCYAPPEMVSGQSYVPQMCDLWSCGVILFAMVCGFLPFEDSNTSALYKKILSANYSPPSFISDSVKDLIAGLLTVDPAKRFTIADVRAHAWYRQIPEASMRPRDLVAKQCGLDEDVLEELKRHGFPREYAINCLQNNKHNSVTTTYYLLAAKRRRMMEHLQMEERNAEERRAASPATRPGASTTDQRPEAEQRRESSGGVAQDTTHKVASRLVTSPHQTHRVTTPTTAQASTPNSSRMIVSPETVSRPCSATQAISMQTTPKTTHTRVSPDSARAQASTPNSSRMIVSPETVSRPCSATQAVRLEKSNRSSTVPVSRRVVGAGTAPTAPSTPRQPARGAVTEVDEKRFTIVDARYARPMMVNTRVAGSNRVQVSRVVATGAPPTPRQPVTRGVAVQAHMAYPTAWVYGGRIP
ncbi:unnamed protein product [Durusdinium trenchii]|uniref:Non-specific serine/threonine protein kinase n=1 Tax=Durusdinium trenchii TaxID=1381693 RepID=A0ABP0M0W6_9DINO